jgi:hypothetical protein
MKTRILGCGLKTDSPSIFMTLKLMYMPMFYGCEGIKVKAVI